LNVLVGHVEEGLAAIAVQKDVGAESTRRRSCGSSRNSRCGKELVCRSRDLESDWESTAVALALEEVERWVVAAYLTITVSSMIIDPSVACERP
jgi:hypothetical protein